jgi:hypothetical protein
METMICNPKIYGIRSFIEQNTDYDVFDWNIYEMDVISRINGIVKSVQVYGKSVKEVLNNLK